LTDARDAQWTSATTDEWSDSGGGSIGSIIDRLITASGEEIESVTLTVRWRVDVLM